VKLSAFILNQQTSISPKNRSAFTAAHECIHAAGEMAERIRALSWQETPLGPISEWPETLVWSVNLMLESRFPMSILWGPEMLQFYNDAYLPLTAEKHPSLLGQSCPEQWPEAWHIIGPQIRSAYELGETTFQEKVLVPVRREGIVKDVYWTYSYSPIRNTAGKIGGILVVCQDVTGELLAIRERDAIAANLQGVLDSITDGLAVLDKNWRYTYINEQGARMLGLSAESLIGCHVWKLFPHAAGSLFDEGNHRAVASGQPVHFEEFYPEPLNKWLECHCYPSESGLSVYFRDITERKRSERALAENEARLTVLVEQLITAQERIRVALKNVPLILSAADRDLRYTWMHRAHGQFDVQEIIGRRDDEIDSSESMHELMDFKRSVIDRDEADRRELNLTLEGVAKIYDVTAEPLHDDSGAVIGITVAAHDITRQRLAEEALRKSEKLAVAGRLAATISHEINNPLEAVTNLLYLLRTSTQDEQVREYAVTAEEELGRVSQIVTQSLRFHRQSTLPTEEKLSVILEGAIGTYKGRLLSENIQVARDYRDHSAVHCYSSELRQVFGNFISNAFDAVRLGGTIFLRTRESRDVFTGEQGIRVTVADSGHGMDSQTLKRIAEPFFTTKGINGTGLGLWISKDILQKHCARMRIRSSQREGRSGTVFSVFLPSNAIRGENPQPRNRRS